MNIKKIKQTTLTADDFINKNLTVGDSLINNNGSDSLPDINSLKVAAKYYSNVVQIVKTVVIAKKLSGSPEEIKFLES